jgi:hypothetical protein
MIFMSISSSDSIFVGNDRDCFSISDGSGIIVRH